MLTELAEILVLVHFEVERHPGVSSSSNVPIIVIKGLLLNVLVRTSQHSMSVVDIFGGLF